MNKKNLQYLMVLLCIGIIGITILNGKDNQLGELKDSSSDSSIYENIDNYANVMNYEYVTRISTKSNQKNVHLKDLDFSFYDKINIPGMPKSKKGFSQYPQGLCITEDFVFITSYSDEDECLGEFMVFDIETGEYLFTMGMDKDSHLGGIAYDGENVWVCNSKNKTLERISYDFVHLMATQNIGEVVDATNLVDIYKVNNTPSCITFYNGRLWVGTHNILWNSHLIAYYYDKNEDELKSLSTYNIPPKVQGIAFSEEGEIYLSTSYGRKFSSYIKKYDSVFIMTEKVKEPSLTIEMPPCSEEIVISEGILYVLFESAGEKYFEGTDGKGKSLSPLDQILEIPLKKAGG